MERPTPKPDDNDGPWVGLFVLLPLVAVFVAAALWVWRWEKAAAVDRDVAALADKPHMVQPLQGPRPQVGLVRPAPTAPAAVDAGPAAALTLKALRSMFDVGKLLHRNAEEAAANVERYCAETAKLPKHVYDDPPDAGPLRDAASFMEPLVTWETHPPTEGLLRLPPPLIDRIRAAKGGWPNALVLADTAGLDFSWLTHLEAYDTWSLASAGAVADQAATVDPLMAPIPDYRNLLWYAKLRLARALAQGDVAAGLGDVQHLADIVHSNGITVAEMYSARIAGLEQPFLAAAAERGYQLPGSTAPLDQAGGERLGDLTMAGVAFALPGVDESVFKRAMECMPSPCAAVTDVVTLHVEFDRLADRPDDASFWDFAQSHACDSRLIDLVKASPSGSLDQLAGWLGGTPLPLEKLFGPGLAGPSR